MLFTSTTTAQESFTADRKITNHEKKCKLDDHGSHVMNENLVAQQAVELILKRLIACNRDWMTCLEGFRDKFHSSVHQCLLDFPLGKSQTAQQHEFQRLPTFPFGCHYDTAIRDLLRQRRRALEWGKSGAQTLCFLQNFTIITIHLGTELSHD
eukprot:scaffold2499_cov125-Cylindrotheca_fusiformis.AAC.11